MRLVKQSELEKLEDQDRVRAFRGKIVKVSDRRKGGEGERKWTLQNVKIDMGDPDELVTVTLWNREALDYDEVKGKSLLVWEDEDNKKSCPTIREDDKYGKSINVPKSANLKVQSRESSSDDDGPSKEDDDEKSEKKGSKGFTETMTDLANLYLATADLVSNVVIPGLPEDVAPEDKNAAKELVTTFFIEANKKGMCGLAPSRKKEEPDDDRGGEPGGDDDDVPKFDKD